MKRGGAQQADYVKRARQEQMDGGAFHALVGLVGALCLHAGSLNDENRKLAFTVEALKRDDPFAEEDVMHIDIHACLRCIFA